MTTPSTPTTPPETASAPTDATTAPTRLSMQDAAQRLADLVNKESGTTVWVGMPGEQAFPEMLRGVEEIVRQRDAAVAPRLKEFFEFAKHGEPDHIEWLREKFESFWGIKV